MRYQRHRRARRQRLTRRACRHLYHAQRQAALQAQHRDEQALPHQPDAVRGITLPFNGQRPATPSAAASTSTSTASWSPATAHLRDHDARIRRRPLHNSLVQNTAAAAPSNSATSNSATRSLANSSTLSTPASPNSPTARKPSTTRTCWACSNPNPKSPCPHDSPSSSFLAKLRISVVCSFA